MLNKRIEEVSLNSWPALQQILFDGWVLRFSKGYTKRANSVNPLYGSSTDVVNKIRVCEKCYAEKGLVPIFRLTPFASPSNLDQVLEKRDYRVIDRTAVMCLDLRSWASPSPSFVALREEELDGWMAAFCRLSGSPVEKHRTHKEMLRAIPSRRCTASLVDAGRTVACGLGVLENGYLGIFDLIVDPEQRGKGYGTSLVSGLLSWARENGAKWAYLQVMYKNEPARRLYGKLGFQEAYAYWYRVPGV
jgi:GNAT superfamily N-acetyltransferase